jgi:hypothetical protein
VLKPTKVRVENPEQSLTCPNCTKALGRLHTFTLKEAFLKSASTDFKLLWVCCPECHTEVTQMPAKPLTKTRLGRALQHAVECVTHEPYPLTKSEADLLYALKMATVQRSHNPAKSPLKSCRCWNCSCRRMIYRYDPGWDGKFPDGIGEERKVKMALGLWEEPFNA